MLHRSLEDNERAAERNLIAAAVANDVEDGNSSYENASVLDTIERLVADPEAREIEEVAADIYWPIIGPIWRTSHWGEELLPEGIGVSGLLNEVKIHIWGAFLVTMVFAVLFRHNCFWPASLKRIDQHMTSLGGWLAFAAVFATAIAVLMGQDKCEDWVAGYFLEFFFMVENVFVFQSVVKTTGVKDSVATNLLKKVVYGQIVFEAIFFIGLARYLQKLRLLPHILGLALLFFGLSTVLEGIPHSFSEEDPGHHAHDHGDSVVGRFVRSRSEKSLAELDSESIPEEQLTVMDGGIKLTLAGWTLLALLLTDFMFEIDTVLTKIEEIDSHFISLSSSAVAAFALPELYMISQDLMLNFPHLKYGIGGVLTMFGLQLMAAPMVSLSPFLSCLIMFAILAVSMLISATRSYWAGSLNSASRDGLSSLRDST
eukprot:CAMPEP_0197652210 /NCGR_PEP_ID=MMETSP1338-20131121/34303_1 /TAXON_ID=43686 ORGANISM="Pelagodinium beii, Strain RCC1491" /NCGR_SAMPLE_ID=MMETSP1338 /ASSEMBLY_ACC=CAM_ASM_000754 /LENGTH=427 /DNA_ID=CAMNT_0043227025 /DNA_START=196 /DNA_END=1479 /DNA_ORIENTATION=-